MTIPSDLPDFLSRLGLPTDFSLEPMHRLYDLLLEVNEKVNLTRITDERAYWLNHVADSLLVYNVFPELLSGSLKVADVGCGGGFPILPLAWANPLLNITGVESRGKKSDFIRLAADQLGLSNVDVVHAQAREAALIEELTNTFDVVLLRAVGQAGPMLKEVRRLVKPGGIVIHYKTPTTVEMEWAIAVRETKKFHFTLDISELFELPGEAGQRQFIIMRHTPASP